VGDNGRGFKALWRDEAGISSVEYAMLLAMIAGGIVMGADMLSNAVSNEMTDSAALFDDNGCDNGGGGDGTGGDGGSGQGGGNTC
jgi:Flp pilus assembly pilin Flp